MRKSKLKVVLTLLVISFTSVFFYVFKEIHNYLKQPLNISSHEIITVKFGTNLNAFLSFLNRKGWISSHPTSRLLHYLHPDLVNIKAGTFKFQKNMTLEEALNHVINGEEHQFSITFLEGSRFSEWRKALSSSPYLEHTITDLNEKEIAYKLGLKQEKLEGLLLAETYYYTVDSSDIDILKRANRKLNEIVNTQWLAKQSNLPIKTPYEALILASIIQKEASLESERKRIASVFINRLNKRMRLQSDPTVIYGMGDKYDGNIRKSDLFTPTPYNTYVINGLPPTPIAMIGKASIEAALHPERSEYLYFVASGDDDGHIFSKNLSKHNTAVRAYLKKVRSIQ
ncbi:periplasmic solute binding protein [Candidatus Photodesmus blepharus]|uniref:Endolytic murein transglycosylase n=1 Tax=Candidatus Photodesmus blepharonis TaxID=1179155 RepID=A0A084CN27_9GAMM|nr:endolytic transglycosylase MltG [Candidatus Photodesmus blepharus]KEY91206.1 periplasmic solute binding protein [Candidatus Photodesmus blepharus]